MSHGITKNDTMVSGMGEKPWHGLGTIVDGALTAEQALTMGGMNWTVHKEPIYRPKKADDGKINIVRVKGFHSIVRDHDDLDLGVVSDAYEPIQNVDMFRFFDPIVAREEAMYHTAGTLFDGRRVWILAKLPGHIALKGDDLIEEYVLVTTRHDGGGSMIIKPTPVRVVCNNTLTLALRQGRNKFGKKGDVNGYVIRHIGDVRGAIEQAAKAMGFVNKLYEELAETYAAMQAKQINEDDTMEFLKRCLRIEAADADDLPDDGSHEDEKEEKLPRALTSCLELLETGKGMDIPANRGSLWNAYNAVTEYVDHKPSYRSDESRLNNVWFQGQGQSIKNRALREAKELLKV